MVMKFSLYYDNFCTKSDAGDKIKYCSLPKNIETQQAQQEHTKENTKKATKINWDKGRTCSEHRSKRIF